MTVNNQLRRIPQFFRPATPNAEGWSEVTARDRLWEDLYRRRWQFDKIVRSTHGVNCTGSCSWRIHVKDGLVTWETQQTDYPTNGPEKPEYEPRGCARGASFSWYLYSPLRVRHPYVRGALWELWREALGAHPDDPVAAWASIVSDPARRARYQRLRGKGGFVRAPAEELYRLIAASLIHTIRTHGPDRVAGFTPIPAMSMVSYAGGSRFLSLLGGVMLSFYDWYSDLPPASPQVWGEQTDVPESADWYDSSYLILWGSNVPMTRTPDAHFMTEVRYRGAKVAVVSPDYSDHVKFADEWLPVRPGTDGALALAMTHVVLREFFVEHPTDYFVDYGRKFTDLPFLVRLSTRDGRTRPDRFLSAQDLGLPGEHAEWKSLVWASNRGQVAAPNGTIGFRWEEGGRWNLDLGEGEQAIEPALTFQGTVGAEVVSVRLPYFGSAEPSEVERAVPARRLPGPGGDVLVTTVYDLLLAQMGVDRELGGGYPASYDEPAPYTPAWQEAITGIPRAAVIRIAREFAQNAAATRGRSMIVMGAGINHWFHNDAIYRAILNLVLLCGCQGVNGGGWAHYVGQEKVRPLEGWTTVAFGLDWTAPPRQQNATSYFYFAADQWRYDAGSVRELLAPGESRFADWHVADFNVLAARLGWLPSYPQFRENPLALARGDGGAEAGTDAEVIQRTVAAVRAGSVRFSVQDPDDPVNFPRVLFVWRGNLIGASAKGHEYFLRHLLGTHHGVLAAESSEHRPREVSWPAQAPEGKLDLLIDLNFRMEGTALYSDIVLPAATWYEKHDLSSTDLHPFVHPFNPAVGPLWESQSDWDTFREIARVFSEGAKRWLPAQRDLVATPLLHDTADEIAQPLGEVRDWRDGTTEPMPGRTFPRLTVVPRDYPNVYRMMTSLGPRLRERGIASKGLQWPVDREYAFLRDHLGVVPDGVGAGCPSLGRARDAAEAILALSGATNGAVAVRAWKALERRSGVPLADLAEGREEEQFRFDDLVVQPRRVITAPVWSGIEAGGRKYSAFCVNVERRIPWRTLTGRQQFYVDHELLRAFGEALPVYRPPVDLPPFASVARPGDVRAKEVVARWITPHSKWSNHSTYSDNLRMLTLSRGGPTVWLNDADASGAEIRDNDWIEVLNRHGALVARAMVTHRVPPGMAIMYHAQDRTIHVPLAPSTRERGGLHNSVTAIRMKPTQMVGGYAQLSYGFNYYGPTGAQRDTLVVVRRLAEVSWDGH